MYNENCFSVGLHSRDFNIFHRNDDYGDLGVDYLLELAQDYVYKQKLLDTQKRVDNIHIGGPVEWMTMDNTGEIEKSF